MNYKTVFEWSDVEGFSEIFGDIPNILTELPETETSAVLYQTFIKLYGLRVIYLPYDTTTYTSTVTVLKNYIDYYTQMYKYKYNGLLASEKFEYDPIENYNMEEEENNSRSPNITKTGSQTVTPNLKENAVLSGSDSTTGTGSSTKKDTGTVSAAGTGETKDTPNAGTTVTSTGGGKQFKRACRDQRCNSI